MRQFLRTTATIFVALVFTAGMAFGQSTTTNKATVTQSGDNHEASLEQEKVGDGAVNEAVVNQSGNGNTVDNFEQIGSGNYLNVDQDGSGNIVRQPAQQGQSDKPSYDGIINIKQDGTDNVVWDLDQVGRGNEADIDQVGKNNFVDYEAQDTGGDPTANFAKVKQDGDGNRVGTRDGNAGLYQTGSGIQGEDNEALINQTGNDNIVGTKTVEEAGYNPSFFSDLFGSGEQRPGDQSFVQAGDNLLADVDQAGGDIVDYVLQTGQSQELDIDQTGSGGSEARAVQAGGNNNVIDIQQSGDADAGVFQTGGNLFTNNEVYVDQSQGVNTATVTQTGNGSGNVANVTQGTGVNTATVTQSGSSNTATVTQN
jgi:hypothetical protein